MSAKKALAIVPPQLTKAVRISTANYEALRTYSDKTGIQMQRALNEAVDDFVRNCIPARLEALGLYQKDTKRASRRRG